MSQVRLTLMVCAAAIAGSLGVWLVASQFVDSQIDQANAIFVRYLKGVGDDPSYWRGPIRETGERSLARFVWISPGPRGIQGVDVISGDQDLVCRWTQEIGGKPIYQPCIQVRRQKDAEIQPY